MNMHKSIRLTPHDRQQIWQMYKSGDYTVTQLSEIFRVSRPTIYKVLARARKHEFLPRSSTNARYRTLKYGLKRLAKVEQHLSGKPNHGQQGQQILRTVPA